MSSFADPCPNGASKEKARLRAAARSLLFVRPLSPYPGWRFDADWDNPDPAFQSRRQIWGNFRELGVEAPLEMTWYDGLKLTLHLGNDLSKQLFVAGCIDPNEFWLLDSLLSPGMVFIDAGANDGLYSLFASRRVGETGKVWAFEPSGREFQRLIHSLTINKLGNVRAFRLALSDHTGEAELMVANAEHSGHNTLGGFSYPGVDLLRRETVNVQPLDVVVAREGLQRVDILKLDVEGAETHLLRGAASVLRNMRPVVLFELLERALGQQGSSSEELLDILTSSNYAIYAFDEATGRLVGSRFGGGTGNLVAVPVEKRLPEDVYAPAERASHGTAEEPA